MSNSPSLLFLAACRHLSDSYKNELDGSSRTVFLQVPSRIRPGGRVVWDCLCSPTGASFECMYIAILSQVASVLGCMPQCLHGPACQINGWQTDLLHERAGTTRRRGCCRKSRVGCSCAELGPADTATAAEADPTCSCCCGYTELATADAAAKGGCCDVDVGGGTGTELRNSAW